MGHVPVQRLHRANVVVHDLRSTARRYAEILGITRWDVHHWTPDRLAESQAYGYRAVFGFSTATGSTPSGVTFRLVQPTHGFSTFAEFLITRGIGVHSLCTAVLDSASLAAVAAQSGLALVQSASAAEGSRSVLLDARKQLGGFLIELQSEAPQVAPEERWDFGSEVRRPESVEWLVQIPKIGHFGIAVTNVMERLPNYASLLGVERWTGIHFDTAGALQDSTFDGQLVDNAWLVAITEVADFGLELLQSTREPTDYGRTVARCGEGIHHVLVRRGVSEQEWTELRSWMEAMQIRVVMSGRPGAAEFFYLDTRSALGFLLEVIVTRASASASPLPRFELDFSTPA